MANRKFLRATVAANDSSFVAVIERKARGWVCFTVSPSNLWSSELKTKAAQIDPAGSWVQSGRDVYGVQMSSRHPQLKEFHKRTIPAGTTLYEAVLFTQRWLRNFSPEETVVSLIWEGVSFTLEKDGYYKVSVNHKGDSFRDWYPCTAFEWRALFKRSPLVRRTAGGNILRIRLVSEREKLQATFQELADMFPMR